MSLTIEKLDTLATFFTREPVVPFMELTAEQAAELIDYARERAARERCEGAPPCPDDGDRSTYAPRAHTWDVTQLMSPWMNGIKEWQAIAHCKGAHKGFAPKRKGSGSTPTAAYVALAEALADR